MARDGSGNHALPEAAFVFNTVIDEAAVNSNFSDISNSLTESLAKDGQTTPTANLPMGGFRHTGVGNASARSDYSATGQVQDGAFTWCGTAGGTANALTLTPSPAITAYAAGQRFTFKAGASANTGATTIVVSGLASKAVQRDGAALAGGEIEANKFYSVFYDGTQFQITRLSQLPSAVTVAGATGGAANAYTAAPPNTLSAYYDNLTLMVEANHTNTGASTLNVDSLGAKAIVQNDGTALAADMITSGGTYIVRYDSVGDKFYLLNPNSVSVAPPSEFTTGDVKLTIKTTADSGWIIMDDGTIGNASSGASTRANADTEDLFTLLWDNVSDTYAPVSSGRGASAAADYAANKTIGILTVLGRALGVAGAGSGLTSRALGENLGAETHTLTKAESPTDLVRLKEAGPAAFSGGSSTVVSSVGSSGSVNVVEQASGNAHSIMQPETFFNVMMKL